MSLFIASLNSGSNGNCYYVGNDKDAILVDAGISCREIEKRLLRLKLSISTIRAVFISHEHIDHIKGIEVLSAKFRLPVYITPPMLGNSSLRLDNQLVNSFQGFEPIPIGSLQVHPFPKMHDAADPYSFMVEYNSVKVGVFTDIGIVCENLIRYFKQCNAVFLEANYDEDMLENGRYPYHLKKRISGDNGHLSNRQAVELLINHRPPALSHLLLAHLSKENNTPDIAVELFQKHAGNTQIIHASRFNETEVYRIVGKPQLKPKPKPVNVVQATLF